MEVDIDRIKNVTWISVVNDQIISFDFDQTLMEN
jgi:hypothetical protein